jgi:hypothetical protein
MAGALLLTGRPTLTGQLSAISPQHTCIVFDYLTTAIAQFFSQFLP